MTQKIRISWTRQAKKSLKNIYDSYKEKSPQGALNVKNDLLRSPRTIRFAKQYQVDDINPNYRRIVVRDFKVLYKEDHERIVVIDIVSSRRSPDILGQM